MGKSHKKGTFVTSLSNTAINIIRSVCLFTMLSSLVGCNPYPPFSTGGYAQHYPMRLAHARLNLKDPLQQCQRAYFRLTKQLLILRKSQVQRCYPARMVEMTLLARQIAQEIAASLTLSAQGDIALLEHNIAAVWPYRFVSGCPKLKNNPHWLRLQSRIQ